MERERLPMNLRTKLVLLVSEENGSVFVHSILGIKGPVGTVNVTTAASVVRIFHVHNMSLAYLIDKCPNMARRTARLVDNATVVARMLDNGSWIGLAISLSSCAAFGVE